MKYVYYYVSQLISIKIKNAMEKSLLPLKFNIKSRNVRLQSPVMLVRRFSLLFQV